MSIFERIKGYFALAILTVFFLTMCDLAAVRMLWRDIWSNE